MSGPRPSPPLSGAPSRSQAASGQKVVLSVLPDSPFPAHTGLHLRMVNNLDLVRRLGCQSHVLYFLTEERSPDAAALAELERACDGARGGTRRKPQTSFSTRELISHKLDFMVRGALGLRGRRYPFSMRYDAVGAGASVLAEARRIGANYVVLPSFMIHYAAGLQAAGFGVIADAIDVLTELTASLLANYSADGRFGRASLLANHWACRTQEKAFLPFCAEIWATTEKEQESLRRIAPGVNVVVVPNGMDELKVRPAEPAEAETVGFIGTYSMSPNVEAACFLAEQVFPALLQRRPRARLRLAGAKMAPALAARLGALPHVDLLGAVNDSAELFESSSVIALPVFVCGGTPLKLVEGMARGKAVVASTAMGAKQPVRDGHDVVLRDDAPGFADALATLLTDRAEKRRLGANARETFLRTWSRASAEAVMRSASVLARP